MTRSITAKIKCTNKNPATGDYQTLTFQPDYADGRNKEWAAATPALSLTMSVKESVAGLFEPGNAFTLTFTPDEDQDPNA